VEQMHACKLSTEIIIGGCNVRRSSEQVVRFHANLPEKHSVQNKWQLFSFVSTRGIQRDHSSNNVCGYDVPAGSNLEAPAPHIDLESDRS